MKEIKIFNKQNVQIFGANLEESEIDSWLEIIGEAKGLPERWVQAKELMENGNPNEPEHWVWHSEHYEDSDVLQTEEKVNEVTGEKNTWVLLKAEYTVEVVDLDNDYDYLLSECHRKRREEYPPVGEYLDAVVKGDEAQVSLYVQKCLEVKAKYPKPNKGGA